MSYVRMGSDSGLVDPDVIDLTNDPELLGGAAALNKKATSAPMSSLINRVASTFSAPPGATPKTASPAAPKRKVAVVSRTKADAFVGSRSTGTAPGMKQRSFDPAAMPSGTLTSGFGGAGSNKWLLIGGAALVVGGIAFFALRKRS